MADTVNVMSLSNEEIIAELVKGEVTVAEGTKRPELVKAYKEMKKAQAEAQEDIKEAQEDIKDAQEEKDEDKQEKPQEDGKEPKTDEPKAEEAKEKEKPEKPEKKTKGEYEVIANIKMGGKLYQKGDKIASFK